MKEEGKKGGGGGRDSFQLLTGVNDFFNDRLVSWFMETWNFCGMIL